MTQGFQCPRRAESPICSTQYPEEDHWAERGGRRTCSYCGSAHPKDLFEKIAAGERVIPTDKSYKIYFGAAHAKFYFQHLDVAQQDRFIELYNNKAVKMGEPGYFYVMPFFAQAIK